MGHPICVVGGLSAGRRLAVAEIPGPLGFDFYSTGCGGQVMAIAAPWPVFGACDEATFDGIAMNVLQLFDVLAMGEDVEVVVAGLPELAAVAFEELGGFRFEDVEGCC